MSEPATRSSALRARDEEVRAEVDAVFKAHSAFNESLKVVMEAVDKSVRAGADLERLCRGRVGVRMFLSRRLCVKESMAVLRVAHAQLSRSSRILRASAGLQDSVLDEAVELNR